MRFIFGLVATLLVLNGTALAQTGMTASQTAIAINSAVDQMAQALERQDAAIKELQKENADLKTKCGDRCIPAAKK